MELQNYLTDKFNQLNKDYDLGELNLNSYYAGRTKFQLEHFVQNEHDTPERKFLQLIMELKSLRDGYIIDSLEIEKIKLQIDDLLSTGNKIDKIEALKKQYTLGTMNEAMEYRKREIKNISDLLKKLPKFYTYEEIEASEKNYWERRLTRQCVEEMVSRSTGINPGNIRSIIQSECALGEKFLALENLLINDFKNAQLQQIQ
jgi:hypothetical protein